SWKTTETKTPSVSLTRNFAFRPGPSTSRSPSLRSPWTTLLAVVRETESLRARSARWSAPSLTRVAMARSRLVLSTADPRGRWRGPVVDGRALHDPREGSGAGSPPAGACQARYRGPQVSLPRIVTNMEGGHNA